MTGSSGPCCAGQDRQRREPPAVTVCDDRLLGGCRLGEMRVAVGQRGHTPAPHPHTTRCLPADRARESGRGLRRRSSRAAGALARWSRPSTVLVTVDGRVLLRCRTWSNAGTAHSFHPGWGYPGLGGRHRRDLLRCGLTGHSGGHYPGSAVQLLCPHVATYCWSRDSLLSTSSDGNGLPVPYRRTCPVLRYVRRLPRGWP